MEDIRMNGNFTIEDLEITGHSVVAPIVEWKRFADAGLIVVGTTYVTVVKEDEDGKWIDEEIHEVHVDPAEIKAARQTRTWWDKAADSDIDWA